jgi:hypothetical protein
LRFAAAWLLNLPVTITRGTYYKALQQLAKEALGSFGIAPTLHQDVEHMAVLVDGTPKVMLRQPTYRRTQS